MLKVTKIICITVEASGSFNNNQQAGLRSHAPLAHYLVYLSFAAVDTPMTSSIPTFRRSLSPRTGMTMDKHGREFVWKRPESRAFGFQTF